MLTYRESSHKFNAFFGRISAAIALCYSQSYIPMECLRYSYLDIILFRTSGR